MDFERRGVLKTIGKCHVDGTLATVHGMCMLHFKQDQQPCKNLVNGSNN